MKNIYSRLQKIEAFANQNIIISQLHKIPNSWLRYEDPPLRSAEVVKAYENMYGVKVRSVFCIPAFSDEEGCTNDHVDGDYYFPDEDKNLQNKKSALIYCFCLKDRTDMLKNE
jgi:hypothetical protein